ncbi:hypothetical protein PR003_g21341 [Phytophthora rubi]|uniref:Secreted protein n=1 Tax=Phytophthora rubi TaxID=129364 RepID=A0A6A3KIN6_9STRA|nr:hypothetical protein PR002_g21524 [Phytophthora rubi]KAE9007236.1 hypothetical protein PR001_g17015 [Phytophthora rubi]KAE9306016.1 hypothetical protein PR003_g21341 [Phytophthora rubi]
MSSCVSNRRGKFVKILMLCRTCLLAMAVSQHNKHVAANKLFGFSIPGTESRSLNKMPFVRRCKPYSTTIVCDKSVIMMADTAMIDVELCMHVAT